MRTMSENDGDRQRLEERVAALEQAVASLRAQLQRSVTAHDSRAKETTRPQQVPGGRPTSPTEPSRQVVGTATPTPRSSGAPKPDAVGAAAQLQQRLSADPGQWLNRLGIGLLLFGIVLGFRYSIDRGWIGPAVRVGLGLALSVALLLISTRLRTHRRGLSRLLAGGGVVAAYLSIFAAFQLYELIPYGVAFAGMVTVTVLGFALAMRDNEAVMAILATAGGLGTPFLLYAGPGSLVWMSVYTCLVLAGAGAVFMRTGWRLLLWTATVGGWFIFSGAAIQSGRPLTADTIAVQAGLAFLALATWGLAVGRDLLSAAHPDRWPSTPSRGALKTGATNPTAVVARAWTFQAHQLTMATPIALVLAIGAAWHLRTGATGWVALGLAAIWGLVAFALRGTSESTDAEDADGDTGSIARNLAWTHAMAAAVLVAFAVSDLLGNTRLMAIAAEALALHLLARRSGVRRPAILAHVLFVLVGIVTLERLHDGVGNATPILNLDAFIDLFVIAAAAVSAWIQSRTVRLGYAIAAQAGLLLWLGRELGALSNGAAWVTAAWFVNAVALLVVGLRGDSRDLRRGGAVVMAMTIAKLFLFDLSEVDPGWRVVTFLACGVALLGLGYAFPTLWRNRDLEADNSSES